MSAEPTKPLDATIRQTLEEHRIITQLTRQMLKAIENKPEGDLTAWQKDMQKQCTELYDHLKKHFELEENGGFMTPVIEENPSKESTVQALKEEHQILLDDLDTLTQKMCSIPPSDCDACEQLCESFQQLVKALRKHERIEDQMIQSVFTDDIGTKD